jgi:hypothetical protein
LNPLLKYVLLCLFSIQAAARPDDAQKNNGLVRVVTESMIKSAGITSIAEVVALADNWNSYTIDGSSGFYSVNSLSPYQRQGILTFIDGLRTDVEIFDTRNLNILPVSIDQVDYVEFISTPVIYMGSFAPAGVIHIHTKTSGPGLSVQAAHTIGDETGDPGPLVFTELTSPNVDKLAQFFSVGISSAGENWLMNAHIKHEETFETDPAINERILNLNSDDNKTRIISYWFKTGIRALSGLQQFTIGYTTNNDYLFFRPYGNEIPVKQIFRQFGFNGGSRFSEFGINYSARTSLNELGYMNNNKNIYFDFGLNSLSVNLEAFYRSQLFSIKIGAGNDKYTAATASVLTDRNISIRSLYLQADIFPAGNLHQALGIFSARNYDDYSLKGFLNSKWNIDNHHSVFAGFSYIETLFSEDNNYWVWRNRGYRFNYSDDDYNVPAEFNTKKTFTADAEYSYRPDSLSSFRAGVNFRRFSDYYLEKQFYQFDSLSKIFYSLTEVKPEEYLETGGAYAGIDYKITQDISAGLFYSYTAYSNGSELFKETWRSLPRHNVTLSLTYQPFGNFGLNARLKYYSSTLWYEYKYVSYQSDEEYIMEVKPGVLLDLSANIWLWHKRIWLNAAARNLFNEIEKYNTIGADLDLRVYIQLHFYFNSLIK